MVEWLLLMRSFVRQARANRSTNFFKRANFNLAHPLARNAISCCEILKPDRWFRQEARFKYVIAPGG